MDNAWQQDSEDLDHIPPPPSLTCALQKQTHQIPADIQNRAL